MTHYINPSLRKLEYEFEDKKQFFNQVKKNWNMLIRNYLTKNMGVNLSEGEERFQISVTIKASYDESFINMIENNFPELDFEEYFVLDQYLKKAEESKKYFDDKKAHHLKMSCEYANYRLKDFDLLQISNSIFNFLNPANPDVFGCYKINTNEVEIYIFPIMLFCQLHGLDVESFIVMVLTHELAHAYNHIGRDKDGYFWESFNETDDNLAEGLAQFYTFNFLRHYQGRNYKLIETFEKTIPLQPAPYRVFKEWGASMEQVYRAFIDVRRNNLNNYHAFSGALENAKGRIAMNRYF